PALVVWPDHRPEQGRALPLAAARVRLGNRPSLDIQAARATLRDARLNAGRRIGGTARQFGPGEVTMDGYPAIEDHGLIGDLQTAALVSTEGIVDWYCAPRFDSPSIFASLLDRQRGGYFQIAPDGVDYVTKQLYLPGTPILITRFLSADGVGEVIDFMPVAGGSVAGGPIAGSRATDQHRLVRMVQVVRGQMRFRFECHPRF